MIWTSQFHGVLECGCQVDSEMRLLNKCDGHAGGGKILIFRNTREIEHMSRCDACGQYITADQKNVGYDCDLHACCVGRSNEDAATPSITGSRITCKEQQL